MLTDRNLLVIDQVTDWLTNDFVIADDQGVRVGTIRTQDGLGSLLLAGSRELSVYDEQTLLLHVSDPPNFGLDTFEVTDQTGAPLARITKEFTFFQTRLTAEVYAPPTAPVEGDADPPAIAGRLQLAGDWLARDFTVTWGGKPASQVARRWPGLAQGLLGKNRYVLLFDRELAARERSAVLGVVIALDLVREKQERRRRTNP